MLCRRHQRNLCRAINPPTGPELMFLCSHRLLVVVPRVLSQDPAEVPFAVDQQVIEALAPRRSHVPLRKRIRPR